MTNTRRGLLKTAFQQVGLSQTLRPRREPAGRTVPPQLVHVVEEARVSPQRRQVLEEQRSLALVFPQHARREILMP